MLESDSLSFPVSQFTFTPENLGNWAPNHAVCWGPYMYCSTQFEGRLTVQWGANLQPGSTQPGTLWHNKDDRLKHVSAAWPKMLALPVWCRPRPGRHPGSRGRGFRCVVRSSAPPCAAASTRRNHVDPGYLGEHRKQCVDGNSQQCGFHVSGFTWCSRKSNTRIHDTENKGALDSEYRATWKPSPVQKKPKPQTRARKNLRIIQKRRESTLGLQDS